MKYLIAIILVTLCVPCFGEVSLSYGQNEFEVYYYNTNNHPDSQELYPIGPLSFRLDQKNIWVADTVGDKIIKVNNEFEPEAEFSLLVTGTERTHVEDFALVTDDEGIASSLWLIEGLYNKILQYDIEGNKLQVIEHDNLIQPSRIQVVGDYIFVADKVARSILVFDSSGAFVTQQNWEWSGFYVSESLILYRLFYMHESDSSYIVGSDLEGNILHEAELEMEPHLNPRLWKVNEKTRELILTYVPPTGFEGTFEMVRASLDGAVIAKKEFEPPYVMNRFIDFRSFEDAWLGVANYELAPEGNFKIQKFDLPQQGEAK